MINKISRKLNAILQGKFGPQGMFDQYDISVSQNFIS